MVERIELIIDIIGSTLGYIIAIAIFYKFLCKRNNILLHLFNSMSDEEKKEFATAIIKQPININNEEHLVILEPKD